MNDTPITKFLHALYQVTGEKAKPSGKGWSARCPAHPDQQPSLSIAEGDGGRALVRCHAGCTTEAIVAAVGLRLADLMPADRVDADTNRPRPRKTGIVSTSTGRTGRTYPTARDAAAELERRHGKPSAMWTYRDAQGEPVGLICRWDKPTGKDIRPISRNGDAWIIGGMPEPRPLYRLPELGDARRVFVTEGEKAADAAQSLGSTATTSPHGSKSAEKADWTSLAGKEVVILPDNDKAGQAYAEAVSEILAKLTPAPTVKVVELPGLPKGGDIVEWIDAYGDAAEPDELRRQMETMADAAKPVELIRPEPAMPSWQPFPVDALPEPIAGLIRAGSKALGCALSYVALPLLAGLASAIGATRRIKLKASWTEPAVIWAAIVGESGTLKSPAVSLALSPLKRLQAYALAELPLRQEQYERDKAIYEADYAAWKRRGRAAGEPLPEKPEEPRVRRYLIDDITIEALADRLQAAPRGLLCACDELAAWLGSFDQYRAGRGGDAPRWLSIHRADSLLVDRKTGVFKTINVRRAAVSVCGGIQPGTLQRALGVEHVENGLAARLLLAMPPRIAKVWTDATVDQDLQRQVDRVFGRLLALDFRVEEDTDDKTAPIDISFSSDGRRAWIEYYNHHAEKQAEVTGELAAAFAKLEGYAARLALIVHLVRVAADDSTVDQDEIDAQSVRAGAALVGWFANEARRVYETFGESEEAQEQRRLIELIRRKGGSVTPRNLMRSSRQYSSADIAEEALDGLVKAGLGTWREDDHGGGRGRPVRRFVLIDGVNEADGSDSVNASLTEAAADDSDDWGEI